MVINPQDIVFYATKTQALGELYYNAVNMHKPTGVIFQQTSLKPHADFKFFIVGALDANAELIQKKSFDGKTDTSFFEAVAYFEQLIEDRTPQQKSTPPAMGQFVFTKGKDGIILIPGSEPVVVLREDLAKVFTPPSKKPYGRLDMTVVSKPEYAEVNSKFALNFNEQGTADLKADAVYDMTPYQSGGEPEGGQTTPDGVNDEELTLDKIEGEEPQNLKGSDTDNNESGEDKGNQGEKGEEQSEKEAEQDLNNQQGQQGKGEGEGEGSEEQGEQGQGNTGNEGEKDKQGAQGQGEGGVGDHGKEAENGERSNTGGGGQGAETPMQQAQIEPKGIIDRLNAVFKTGDVVYKFKKQQRLLSSLDAYTPLELVQQFYGALNVPAETTKKQFIEYVKTSTQPYFNS